MKRLFKKYLIISVACSLPFFCGEPTAMAQENNALEAVSTLTVRQTDSVSGYDRDLFQWNKFDEDGDGCDTPMISLLEILIISPSKINV